eukprot:3470623-Alexandrium_andersonii.AAC.1
MQEGPTLSGPAAPTVLCSERLPTRTSPVPAAGEVHAGGSPSVGSAAPTVLCSERMPTCMSP